MAAYLRFVERRARAILALLAAVTLFFAWQLPQLGYDTNPYLLAESHPARRSILDLRREFGGTFDSVQVALHNPQGAFNPETLRAVLALSRDARGLMLATPADAARLRALDEAHGARTPALRALVRSIAEGGLDQNDVFAADQLAALAATLPLPAADHSFLAQLPRRLYPVKAVASLAATDNILVEQGMLSIRKSLREGDADPRQVRQRVLGNPMLRGLVSADETTTQVVIEVALKQDDAEGQLRAHEAVTRLVDEHRRRHPAWRDTVHVAGVAVAVAEAQRLTERDLNTLFPLVVLVIGVVLVLYFRRPLGVLLPLLNVVMCSVWTLGTMALLRVPMDTITSMLPVFLVTICGADAIHLLNEFYAQRRAGTSGPEAMRRTMRAMVSPVVLTTVTTVVGFLFSTATALSSVRSFGLFMAVGLVSAQVISLLLIPAWLSLLRAQAVPQPSAPAASEAGESGLPAGRLGRLLARALELLIRNREPAGIVLLALLLGSGWMATQIVVEDAGASYFRADNAYRQADEFINAKLAGTSPGWLRIGDRRGATVLDSETLAFIDRLEAFVRAQPHVSYTYSLASYLRRMNHALHDLQPAHDRLPRARELVDGQVTDGDALIAQLVLMYENGGGDELNYVLKRDGSAAAMLFALNTGRATDYERFLQALRAWLAQHQPAHLQVDVAGTPVIWSAVLDEIVSGQAVSIGLALGSVTLVLMLWLRSVPEGLLTALPLAATTLVYYGAMGLAGIELNIGTALISFIVVGIVDYSVHYLHRIKAGLAAGLDVDDALRAAIRSAGSGITFNVLVYSAGFAVLLCSQYQPILYLGGLVALALVVSGFMSLFLISLLAPCLLAAPRAPATSPRCRVSTHPPTPAQES